MNVQVLSEQDIIREATQVLMKHLSPAKAARFWIAWQVGSGDYLEMRASLFQNETVDTLFEQIKKFESQEKNEG